MPTRFAWSTFAVTGITASRSSASSRIWSLTSSASPRRSPSGFLVEQGLLAGTSDYFEKSHVLKREYPGDDRAFDWMQDSVFDLLEEEDRLHRWETETDLVEAAEMLP